MGKKKIKMVKSPTPSKLSRSKSLPLKSKICPDCGDRTVIYRQINRNGGKVVAERCPSCKKNPNKGRPFLSKKLVENWDLLPLLEDNMMYSSPCIYKGCENKNTEYHHFAPRHLFQDFEKWPGGFLCMEHHSVWHKTTKTGNWRQR